MLKSTLKNLIFLSIILTVISCAHSTTPRYGTWERYRVSEPLGYPDFIFVFKGKKRNAFFPGDSNRRLADIYVFEASNNFEAVEVNWSEGTGNIGPQEFSIGNKNYMIEMFRSDILGGGFVEEDKIVVWPSEEFEAQRNKPWYNFW